MVLTSQPGGFLQEHANTRDFNSAGPLSEIIGNDQMTRDVYRQLNQYLTKDTPLQGVSHTGDVERKYQIDRDLSEAKSAMFIHQGVRDNNNFILTRVMPWQRVDNIIYQKNYIIFDWNNIHLTPYGTYTGNVTSSEHQTHTRLQRYGHGVEFDRTLVRSTSGAAGLRYFRAQYEQMTKDIATAATLMALVALKSARSPTDYYKLSFGNFEEEAENTIRKEASAFLCFARSSHRGVNELLPNLQLGIKILKDAGYTPNIIIYPQNAEGLIIRNMEDKTINYFNFDVLGDTLVQINQKQSLNVVPGTEIAIYTTPQIRLLKYAHKFRKELTEIHEETATISEF
jgi:hypothetical protein